MRKLPGEMETEEKLFSIMFEDAIKRLGWTYYFTQSNIHEPKLFFGESSDIDKLTIYGNFCIGGTNMFKNACMICLRAEQNLLTNK